MKLNYKRYGQSGDPVIILHGIFGMLDNWHSFASQLAEDYRVFTVDQRNHGRSPHSEEFDYPAMIGDLEEFMTDHKLEKVHLIGHSMGGKVAMHFALSNPDKMMTLTVLDIGIKYYPPRHDYIFNALCNMELSRFESRNEIDEYLSEHIHSFSIRQFLIKNIRRNEQGEYNWKMNLPVIRKNYEKVTDWVPVGQSFSGPALFVRGANSSYILMDDWPGIQELFPRSGLVTIPGTGHWLHAEKPYELLKEVKRFLSLGSLG
jgi:pimeloyl-ACP methyl ester carboxylesterase